MKHLICDSLLGQLCDVASRQEGKLGIEDEIGRCRATESDYFCEA